jgi:hypothetical protein
VGPMLTMRGLIQPLTERQMLRESDRLAEGMRLADPASGQVGEEDLALGVAAKAL